jgi:ankyrin repeat protein
MAKLLLDAGADPNVIDLQGQAALVTAIVSGHEEIAGMIFRRADIPANIITDSDINETPLHLACRYKRSKAIRYFLEAGADSNAKDATGSTPLQRVLGSNSPSHLYAPCNNSLQSVLALLEFGANLDSESLRVLRHLSSEPSHRQASLGRIGRIWIAPNLENCGRVSAPHIDEICLHLNILETLPRQVTKVLRDIRS